MKEIDLILTPRPPKPATRKLRLSKARASKAPASYAEDLPPVWDTRVDRISATIRHHVPRGSWNDLFLALSGSLCSMGVDLSVIPSVVWHISHHSGTGNPDKDQATAKATVEKFLRGNPVTGFKTLRTKWPSVGICVGSVIHWDPKSMEPHSDQRLDRTLAEMKEAIAVTQDKLVLISSDCGMGKTRIAMEVAVERAAKGQKTVISVPTNALAIQIYNDILALPGPEPQAPKRLFGPLSIEEGHPLGHCIHKKVALPLVNGGQSLHKHFCVGHKSAGHCIKYDPAPGSGIPKCQISHGYEGPSESKIVIGTHALLKNLLVEAGAKGLVIIDEPPPPVESSTITYEQFENTLSMSPVFYRPYAERMTPIVYAAMSYREERQADAREIFHGLNDTLAGEQKPFPKGQIGFAPPMIASRSVYINRGGIDATKEGSASKIYRLLFDMALDARRQELATENQEPEDLGLKSTIFYSRSEERPGKGNIIVTRTNQALKKAIDRLNSAHEGSGTVILDANIETNLIFYKRMINYEPVYKKFIASDKSHIERIRVDTKASRKHLMPGGEISTHVFAMILHIVKGWIEMSDTGNYEVEPGGSYGLITFKPLAMALISAKGDPFPKGSLWNDKWGERSKIDSAIQDVLGPLLQRLTIAWHGNTRGMNNMAHLSGVITIGDPRPNVHSVGQEAEFIGADGFEADQIAINKCRDELEQGQGRLRTIHRTEVGRALHIGQLIPKGTGWSRSDVDVRPTVIGWDEDRGGRPPSDEMRKEEQFIFLRKVKQDLGITVEEFAAWLNISPSTMKNYLYTGDIMPDELRQFLIDEIAAGRRPQRINSLKNP